MKEAIVLFGATDLGTTEFSADLLWRTRFSVPDPMAFFEIGGKKILFLSTLEVGRAEKEAKGVDEFVLYTPYVQRAKKLNRDLDLWPTIFFLRDRGVTHVTVPQILRCELTTALKRHFKVKIKKAPFYPERAIKTDWEIQEIEKAQCAVGKAVGVAVEFLKKCFIRDGLVMKTPVYFPEVVTSEMLRKIIDDLLYQEGYLGVNSIVACGEQAADPHCEGSGPLKAFQPIVLDIFPRSKKTLMFSDQTRTVFKGEPSRELQQMYNIVLHAQETGISMVKAGIDGKTINDWIVDYFNRRGYTTNTETRPMEGFFHGVGHGVGIDIHEPPRINSTSDILKEGMVVTVEPGLYYSRAREHIPIGGIRIEDMVLITKDGCRNLTKFPKDLDSMIIP